MNYNSTSDFFKKTNSDTIEFSEKHKSIKDIIDTLDATSRLTGQSQYVIDYSTQSFIYVSPNPLFLNGYTVDEVIQMGYHYYEKNLLKEDLNMLLEINNQGFDFFYKQPIEDRLKFTISYDFRLLQPNGFRVMVNHKMTPILLNTNGDIWLSLCVVSLSTSSKPGNVFINQDGILYRFTYSFKSCRWIEDKMISLSKRELEIMQLTMQGMSNEQVAEVAFIDLNTVKFHKKNIFRKLNVKNMTEAIIFAQNNNIL